MCYCAVATIQEKFEVFNQRIDPGPFVVFYVDPDHPSLERGLETWIERFAGLADPNHNF